MRVDISVVVPCYGCREAIPELYARLVNVLEKENKSFEIILVNDDCPQNSWEEINKLCNCDKRVVGIKLSRNFGQMKAITAGLCQTCGDYVIVMDCDLQDRPEFIPNFIQKIEEGYDVVFSKRKGRKDSKMVRFLSKSFYKVYNHFSDMKYDFEVGNYSIAKREVVDNFLKMQEQSRDYVMFLMWLGYNATTIEIEGDERFSGESSYTFRKKVQLATSIIIEQSNKPLFISVRIGFLLSGASAFYILYLLIRYLVVKDFSLGWPSLIASIYLVGGLLMSSIGIVGMYIGNIFSEIKRRPLYVVDKVLNGQKNEE